jgi:exonuclease SbcC
MRPLVVTMQAFGPYPVAQTLDFADLGGAGFFLITGPTGAGKTTVLDAMSFALYGETSGGLEKDGARTGASMRSDHADPQTLTRVSFDFSRGDDLYRVERVPEQERPKLRGEGTTTHLQEATMWRLRRDASGALQVDGGPLATGWSKVNAQAEDVLGFRAEQFRQVVMLPQGRFQQFLEADSTQRELILRALFDTGHYADIERALHDEALKLKRAAETVVTQREEVLRQAEAECADDLAGRCARLELDRDEARLQADAAEREDHAAQKALAAGAEAARKLEEQNGAAAEVAALAALDEETRVRREELEAARRAAQVADVARQAREAAAELADARTALEGATEAADEAAVAQTTAIAALEVEASRTAEREHAAAEVQRLRSLEGGAAALAEARQALARAASAMAARREAADEADAAWREARARESSLSAVWVEAQAGMLAGSLHEGEPCPVCGAVDHPSPAELPCEAPSEDEVEAARVGATGALERRDQALSAAQQAQAAHAAAETLAGERAAGIPGELADPEALAAAITAAESAATVLAQSHDRAVDAAHRSEVAATTRQAACEAAAGVLDKASERARTAAGLLAARLEQAGFSGEDELAAAVRPATVVDELADAIATHEESKVKAAERLRLASAAAEGLEPPDLARLEESAAAAAAGARGAREAAAGLDAALTTAEKLLERLRRLEEDATGVAARYDSIGRLADVAGGRNGRRLSFQSYVLGAFLDDVLVAASARLRTMSKSRYTLARTEERSGRRQAAGLDLVTYDAWTGVSRPVSTLSGGEKFMAALSLALGLAEVVQAHAGGIRLETVFVDEGFGSLDDESLDLAIASLMSLNEGGRLVGIISHVSELRERIDARLEVSADKAGSRARFVVP